MYEARPWVDVKDSFHAGNRRPYELALQLKAATGHDGVDKADFTDSVRQKRNLIDGNIKRRVGNVGLK